MNPQLQQTIIDNARTWINTPWMHNQRIKGLGVDCVQFLAGVAIESGLALAPFPDKYMRVAQNDAIKVYLESNFISIPIEDRQGADIVLFTPKGLNNHLGILSDRNTVIHAYQTLGRVVEQSLDGEKSVWFRMMQEGGVWRIL